MALPDTAMDDAADVPSRSGPLGLAGAVQDSGAAPATLRDALAKALCHRAEDAPCGGPPDHLWEADHILSTPAAAAWLRANDTALVALADYIEWAMSSRPREARTSLRFNVNDAGVQDAIAAARKRLA